MGYSLNGAGEALTIMLGVMVAISIFVAIIGIIEYIFQSIGLFTLSKNRNIGRNWFAWVPVLSSYRIGELADDVVMRTTGQKKFYKWLVMCFLTAGLILYFISNNILLNSSLLGYAFANTEMVAPAVAAGFGTSVIISLIGMACLIVGLVFYYISLYHIYKSCTENYVVFLVLSIIFNFCSPFFLFALRNKVNKQYYPY